MGAPLCTVNGELVPITPSFCAKDSAEITMVGLVALVQSQSSIIKIDPISSWKGVSLLQILKDRGMQRRSHLHSFKGARETGSASKQLGMIQHGPHRDDAPMARTADPFARRSLQDAVASDKLGQERRRGDHNPSLWQKRSRGDDHLRKDSLFMQGGRPWLGFQVTNDKEQGIAPGTTRRITRGKSHPDIFVALDGFPLIHLEKITCLKHLSNP